LTVRTVGLIVASILFLLSLAFETLLYDKDSSFLIGFVCLLFGWGIHLSWYANPLLFISAFLLLLGKPQSASVTSVMALLLAVTAFTIREIERNEAGTMAPVTGYGSGIYLWIGCIATLLVTSLCCLAIFGRRFAPLPASATLR